jgi:hypothetical protein
LTRQNSPSITLHSLSVRKTIPVIASGRILTRVGGSARCTRHVRRGEAVCQLLNPCQAGRRRRYPVATKPKTRARTARRFQSFQDPCGLAPLMAPLVALWVLDCPRSRAQVALRDAHVRACATVRRCLSSEAAELSHPRGDTRARAGGCRRPGMLNPAACINLDPSARIRITFSLPGAPLPSRATSQSRHMVPRSLARLLDP